MARRTGDCYSGPPNKGTAVAAPGKGVILSPPSGRLLLSGLAVPAGISRPTSVLNLDEVAPGIWLRTVEVRKAVLLGQPAARKRAAVEAPDLRVCGEVGYRPAHVAWRFGDGEVRLHGERVAPVGLLHPEVVQHHLRAQPAGGQGDRCAPVARKLIRLRPRQADH